MTRLWVALLLSMLWASPVFGQDASFLVSGLPTTVLHNDEIDASSELLAIMDDETGTGLLVFATTPTLTTPILGVAAGTSVVWDQGTADTAIVSFRSTTDVGTGMTTLPLSAFDVAANAYLTIGKKSATSGGAYIVAVGESADSESLYFEAWTGTPATTDTTATRGVMNFYVGQHDNSNADADMAANSSGFTWGEITSAGAYATRMLLKADDGELHLGNTTLVALDGEDDIAAVRGLQRYNSRDVGIILTDVEPSQPIYDYEELRRIGVIGEKDDEGETLIRVQPYLSLHDGAIHQLNIKMQEMAQEISALRAELDAR
jgi:hypothetical protein